VNDNNPAVVSLAARTDPAEAWFHLARRGRVEKRPWNDASWSSTGSFSLVAISRFHCGHPFSTSMRFFMGFR
jgi:hypothetical protein